MNGEKERLEKMAERERQIERCELLEYTASLFNSQAVNSTKLLELIEPEWAEELRKNGKAGEDDSISLIKEMVIAIL